MIPNSRKTTLRATRYKRATDEREALTGDLDAIEELASYLRGVLDSDKEAYYH